MAQKLRATMSHRQLHDFAATSEKGLPVTSQASTPTEI